MIKELNGNIFEHLPRFSIIMHQVNCLGIAGAGLAKQVRDRFPGWYDSYAEFCSLYKQEPSRLLGQFHNYKVNDEFIICSAFGQLGISKTHPVTDYKAWNKILSSLEYNINAKNNSDGANWSLHIPYGIGCGLAGGDWKEMTDRFDFYFRNSPVQLFIHRI